MKLNCKYFILFYRHVLKSWKSIPLNLMGLIPKGSHDKLSENYLHPEVNWVHVDGTTATCLSGDVDQASQEDSETDVVTVSQQDQAKIPGKITCLRPKFEHDEQFLLELYTSNLSADVFSTNLENANRGLKHVDLARNTVLLHFGAENNLDPVFPSLRLNDSNKNVIDLKYVCDYTDANSYIDKRINIHMKQRASAGYRRTPAIDVAAIESVFAVEVFTQNQSTANGDTTPAQRQDSTHTNIPVDSSATSRADVTPQSQEHESNLSGDRRAKMIRFSLFMITCYLVFFKVFGSVLYIELYDYD